MMNVGISRLSGKVNRAYAWMRRDNETSCEGTATGGLCEDVNAEWGDQFPVARA